MLITVTPSEREEIANLMNRRHIRTLVHFTLKQNLPSICRHGLLGNNELVRRGLSHIRTDEHRFDGNANAICASVSFPNYKMFFKKRMEFLSRGYSEADWVVLELDAMLLREIPAAFTATNAAKGGFQSQLSNRSGARAFEAMFDNHPLRALLGVPNNMTTDPQAEIQVLQAIAPKWIVNIGIHQNADLSAFQSVSNGTPVSYRPALFCQRHDYDYWRR